MSFALETKSSLCTIPIKSACCRKSELFGLLYAQSDFADKKLKFSIDLDKISAHFAALYRGLFRMDAVIEESEKLTRSRVPTHSYRFLPPDGRELDDICQTFIAGDPLAESELFTCENCRKHFLRGLFLAVGTITNPERGYHLEFAVSNPKRCADLCAFLEDMGIPARVTKRRGVLAVYMKESEIIEDFLTLIGAPQAALTIMECKIMRDIRNNENRRNNCDTANIFKSTGAATQQIRAIRFLSDAGLLGKLPQSLRETAVLRLNNPEVSMSELAALHDPPITKSGVSHRLAKIQEFYEKEGKQ